MTQQQISFKSLENDAVLYPDSVTSVSKASDVFTDVQCITSNTAPREWHLSPENSALSSPLNPTVTSFNTETGILRIFSRFFREHARDGLLTFQCSANNSTSSISFELCKPPLKVTMFMEWACMPTTYVVYGLIDSRTQTLVISYVRCRIFSTDPTLFFNGDLPSIIPATEDLLPLCTILLPTLPPYSVAVHRGSSDGTNYSYCLVETDRGIFRSRSVLLGTDTSSKN